MIISQIFLSSILDEPLSPFFEYCVQTIKEAHPNCDYFLYRNESLYNFIQDNYNEDVVKAYNKLIPFSYKADLAKACLLYKLGGFYYDQGIRVISQLNIPDIISCIAFTIEEEIQCLTPFAILPGVLYTKPNNPVFKYVIDIIIDNCNNEYYGHTPFCPTSANVFGRAFAKYYAEEGLDPSFIFGKLKRLTLDYPNKNAAFVLPDGTILALIKPSNFTLGQLGCKGTNTYTDLYFNKAIYNG